MPPKEMKHLCEIIQNYFYALGNHGNNYLLTKYFSRNCFVVKALFTFAQTLSNIRKLVKYIYILINKLQTNYFDFCKYIFVSSLYASKAKYFY